VAKTARTQPDTCGPDRDGCPNTDTDRRGPRNIPRMPCTPTLPRLPRLLHPYSRLLKPPLHFASRAPRCTNSSPRGRCHPSRSGGTDASRRSNFTGSCRASWPLSLSQGRQTRSLKVGRPQPVLVLAPRMGSDRRLGADGSERASHPLSGPAQPHRPRAERAVSTTLPPDGSDICQPGPCKSTTPRANAGATANQHLQPRAACSSSAWQLLAQVARPPDPLIGGSGSGRGQVPRGRALVGYRRPESGLVRFGGPVAAARLVRPVVRGACAPPRASRAGTETAP
jgi:hypothetical protein